MSRLRPGEWGEDRFAPRRRDAGYPIGGIKEPDPVKPHTKWSASSGCNGRCRGATGCGESVWLVWAPAGSVFLEVKASPDGAYVVETSEHRKPMAVLYDAAFHDASWPRFAAHACRPKETP